MNLFSLATDGVDLDALPLEQSQQPRASFKFAEASEPARLRLPRELDDVFGFAAQEYGVDVDVLRGIAYAESRFNPDIISGKVKSPAGAIGLMQFMPETAQEYGIDPTDPVQAIMGGAAYLRKSLDKFDGDYERAVASYNWGPNRKAYDSEDWASKAPQETQKYLMTVFGAVGKFKDGASERGLPQGVAPSKAGAGRGSVSPGMTNTQDVQAVGRTQQQPTLPADTSAVGSVGSAINTGLAKGVVKTGAGLGTFLQDPGGAIVSGLTGGAALLDRGMSSALSAVGIPTVPNQQVQRNAQIAAESAQQRRGDRYEAGNPLAVAGRFMEEDSRRVFQELQEQDRTQNPRLIAQQKNLSEAEGFVGNLKAAAQNPIALAGTLSESMFPMAAGVGAGSLVSRLGGSMGAVSATGTASEAGFAALNAREGVYQAVATMPLEKLAQSPRFQEILRSGNSPTDARELLANELADQAPLMTAAGTAGGTLLTNRLFGGDATAKTIAGTERMTGKELGKRVAQDTVEEVIQGVPEDLVQYGTLKQADPTKKLDLAGSAAQNMVGGFAFGVVGHGGAFARDAMTTPTVESQPTTPQAPPVAPAAPAQSGTPPVAPTPPAAQGTADAIMELERRLQAAANPTAQPTADAGTTPVAQGPEGANEGSGYAGTAAATGQSESAQSLKATSYAQRTATPTPLPGAVPSTTSADAGVRAMVEGIKQKRAQDAEETAQIQQMLAEDDAKAAALVASSVDETARGQAAQIAMQSRARLVDDLVSSYAEPSDFFASRVLPAVDKQLAVLGRPPLAPEERRRIDSLLGSTRAFIRPSLPSDTEAASAFLDVGADNASMESLIKEKQPKPAATGLAAEMDALKARSNKPRQNKAPKPLLTDGERDMLADFERMYQADVKGEIKTRLGLLPARQDEATAPAERRKPSELLAAIKRAGGIKSTNAGDLMGGSAMDANRILPGLFTKGGMNLDLLVPFLKERGYLTQADEDSILDNGGVNKLAEILQAELSGARAQTMDSTAGFESNAEAAMRSELDSKAFALGLPMKVTNEMSTERLNGVINRIERKLGKPVNTDFATRKMSRTEAIAERQAILMADRVERARAQYDADIQAFAEANDRVQEAVLDVMVDEDGNIEIIYESTVGEAYDNRNVQENSGQAGPPVASTAEAGAGNPEANRSEASAGSQETLTTYTPEEVTAQQEAAEKAERTAKAKKQADDLSAKKEQERKEIAQASVAAADTFELGGNAEDNLSGQDGLKFSRKAKVETNERNNEADRKRAIQEAAESKDDLVFSKSTDKQSTPAATIRAAITKAYGNLLDKLEAKGLVTIAQTEREAIEAAAQARADKTGGDVEQIKRSMLASVQMQRVWHGSPHRGIQQFSTDKIGTGEGAQAYGWGLYYASKREIAEDYRKKLSGGADQSPRRFFMGQEFQPGTGGYFAARIVESSTLAKARKDVSEWIKDAETWSDRRKADKGEQETLRVWIDALAILKQADSKSDFTKKAAQGQLYEVEIPEDGDMLLWDKPLSEQPAPARNSAKTMKGDIAQDWLENELDRLNADWNELTGQEFYKLVQRALVDDALVPNAGSMAEQALIEGKTDKAASLLLMDDGIKGIKYLDGTSRNAGDGSSYNYVLFDGADTQIVDVKYSANGNIEGFFDKQTGKSFLVADNLTASSAPGTLMHEVGIHMAADGKLEPLFKRAAQLLKLNKNNPFLQRVQARMDQSGETSAEEAAAYIVTEYENDRANAPASVAQWVKDFIADVRAWLFGKGVLLKADQLTVADIAAVARANAKSMAVGDGRTGDGGRRFSRGTTTGMPENKAPGPQGDAQQGAAQGNAVAVSRQIAQAIQDDDDPYADYGLRVIPPEADVVVQPGDELPPSNQWDDGTDTGEALDGTSAVRIDSDTEDAALKAIRLIGAHGKPGPNGYYYGDQVVLIKGQKSGVGEDVGEILLNDAVVVATWRKPDKGNSEVAPNEQSTPTSQGVDAKSMAVGDSRGDVRNSKQSTPDKRESQTDSTEIRRSISNRAQQPLFNQTPAHTWEELGESYVDTKLYNWQDDRIDLKRVQESITKAGRQIDDQFDARTAETLLPGRLAKRTEDFMAVEAAPLLKDMAKNNVTMEEVSDYMLARHAPERNAQIAKVNPDMPDAGSGTNSEGVLMTTQAANDHIAALTTGKRMVLEMLARRVDAITKGTRDLLVAEGLEKAETIRAWEGAYKHYVPLFRDEAANTPGHPVGSGISVTGSSSKRATGSTKEVTNMLAHVLMQREAAITRAEKNRVGMSLYGMALSHPNKAFWSTVQPKMSTADIVAELQRMGVDPMDGIMGMDAAPTIRTVDDRTGLVVDRPNPMYKKLDNAIVVKVNGEDRVILFNTKNERAMRMAESLKNQHFDQGMWVNAANTVAPVTRFMSAMMTQYNPAFGMVNAVRDIQGALVNLTSTPLNGKQARVLADTPAAVIGIARDIRGDGKRTPWSDLWVQFQEDGGRTGYRDLVVSPYERAANMEKDIKRMQQEGKWTPGNAAHAVLDLLGDFNDSLENGVRLAAYKAALDKGMTRPQAAKLGRELTVDFNRKGRKGRELGKLYAFLNASIQGNARNVATVMGAHGGKVLAGGFALGVLQALMLAWAGYEDDEIREFQKARALIIPIGGKQHITIPMALGFHIIPNTSRILTELMLTGGKDWQTKVPEAMFEIANAANPFGGGGDWKTAHGPLTMVMPTAGDWAVDLALNRDFTGNQISRTRYNERNPGSAIARESTLRTPSGQVYQGISKAINDLTGGSDRKAGAVSPTPEELRYIMGVVGGGVYRETEKAINAAVMLVNGDEIKATQVPLGSRFVSEVRDEDVQRSRYYKNSRTLEGLEADLKDAAKDRDSAKMNELRQDKLTNAIGLNNAVQRHITQINKMAKDDIGDKAAMAQHDANRAAAMRRLNDEVLKLEKQAQ